MTHTNDERPDEVDDAKVASPEIDYDAERARFWNGLIRSITGDQS